MALIFTPGQLNQRGEFYHQLSTLLAAGMTAPQALQQLLQNPPARSFRPHIAQFLELLEQGCTITEAVRALGSWVPSFDAALIEAGDQSGRLDACFKLLALYYSERARMLRQMISDLLYPAFVFHFAIILFPFLDYFRTGNLSRFLAATIGVFVPLYAAIFFVIYACQGRHGETWRSWIEKVLHPVPLLGTARRQLALSRLAAALEALLNAGVPIIGGWTLAAAASGSPALSRRVHTWKVPLESGATPSELVSNSGEFPQLFANLYQTGEISGTLDLTLKRLHALYQEEGARKLHAVALWTPRVVYFGIVFLVAWRVISFYSGYFNQVNQVLDFR
jgi:type II secretory pathway component PulF